MGKKRQANVGFGQDLYDWLMAQPETEDVSLAHTIRVACRELRKQREQGS